MRPLLWAWLVLVCCAGCMEDALRPVPDSPSQPLSVTRVGSGSGTVVSSPEGIVCDPDCQADFEEGSQVTLTATPDLGSAFIGWSGDCTGQAACLVTMDVARNVTARFEVVPPVTYQLAVGKQGAGNGTVVSTPAGINCGATCQATFEENLHVTLVATAGSNSIFAGFSGDCVGDEPCVVAMAIDRLVLARFDLISSCAGTPTIFEDETFDPADWEVISVLSEGDGGSTTATQRTTGGNPGAYREIADTVNPAPSGPSSISNFHHRLSATYDPSVRGPITCVNYSEDAVMIDGFGQGQGAAPALRQGGLVYRGPYFITPDFEWTTHAYPGLTAEDFYLQWNPNQHPDFSTSGGPIELGFVRSNSSRSGGYTVTGGIDNWSFTILSGG